MLRPGIFPDETYHQGGRDIVTLKMTTGASGAVPDTLTRSDGIVSVVYGATGIYTVTFAGTFNSFGGIMQTIKQASYSKAGACDVRVTADSGSAGTVTLLTVDGDGDAVASASGDVIIVDFVLYRYAGR